jgi:hypothetical protein
MKANLTDLYAYRRRPGVPVLCIFGDHEIPEGERIFENFQGTLRSLCHTHFRMADQTLTATLHEEEEKANPALYRERHGIKDPVLCEVCGSELPGAKSGGICDRCNRELDRGVGS